MAREHPNTIESLRLMAPHVTWSMDPVTGLITFAHRGAVDIHDPFVTCCGRFKADPWNDYRICQEAAHLMFAHNLLCPKPGELPEPPAEIVVSYD